MEKVSVLTHILFVLSTTFVVYQLYKASQRSGMLLAALVLWALITAALGAAGFYRQGDQMPPRFLFLVGPGIAVVLIALFTQRGRAFSDSLDIADLTLLHSVRLPIEIVLYQLYAAALVPQIMTFEGINFDIFTGFSAPIIYYFTFMRRTMHLRWLLVWNFDCLILLFTIMALAIMSSPTPFQQFGFEQPNTGVTYFPYVWLPSIIVPAALLSHLVSIRKLRLRFRKYDG
ncbi:hypothetical protein [Pontibacter saemangeumensis]|uniref:hypothetical protein n=1 Tax=Pontibacter saemangeumensis TaxID=1084525 RepID=UPI0031E5E5AE